jgi:hypothetical protein
VPHHRARHTPLGRWEVARRVVEEGETFAQADAWTAETQTAAWCVIFFFASAAASAAYLTVSEIFPMETRALAGARLEGARGGRQV